jgi:bacterial/archaeal transporter family protein
MSATLLLVLSTLLYGVWGYANKLAIDNAHPFSVQWMYAAPMLLLLPLWYWLGAQAAPATNTNGAAILYGVLASLAGAAANLLLYFALQTTSGSVATAVTGAYPLVTLALAVLFGSEGLDARKLVGVVVIVAGILILLNDGN